MPDDSRELTPVDGSQLDRRLPYASPFVRRLDVTDSVGGKGAVGPEAAVTSLS